jgi:CDP-paratose 2-epimerase
MSRKQKLTVITGGAGFVGANLADRLCRMGRQVLIYDNLSREGVEANLRWLQSEHGSRIRAEIADVRDKTRLRAVVAHAESVFHFAAQVAVTSSLIEPVHDFEVNVIGTFNVLEAARAAVHPPKLIFTSTNKVYGNLADVTMRAGASRYEPESLRVRQRGVSEERPLDFHSPYGCSKGAADQYVIDYARSFGLPSAVFRMSCIYGPHQFGTEDQGWVAHFLIRALESTPITLYGDGKQVRDILYVDDLVNAFLLTEQNMDKAAGQALNIGGGVANTISLLELLELIEELHGILPDVRFEDWRTGDQHYYVSDTSRFRQLTGWKPYVSVREGVSRLYDWLIETRVPVLAHEQRRAAS